jgi:hypothetical protein
MSSHDTVSRPSTSEKGDRLSFSINNKQLYSFSLSKCHSENTFSNFPQKNQCHNSDFLVFFHPEFPTDIQIPVIAEKPIEAFGWRKFQLDTMGDHVYTYTTHSGVKKSHDWVVDQVDRENIDAQAASTDGRATLYANGQAHITRIHFYMADRFQTTHTVKTQHVTKHRGHNCGDIQIANVTGPVIGAGSPQLPRPFRKYL